MVLKVLFSGRKVGATAVLADGTSENITIYTVPASKVVHIKEIVYSGFGSSTATGLIQIGILKSGGTAIPVNNTENINNTGQTGSHDAIAIEIGTSVPNNLNFTRLPMNLTLNAGDIIFMRFMNATGGNKDTTAIGLKLHISAYEAPNS